MTTPRDTLSIVLEAARKRTFASVLEWPGWVRSGRDEAGALETLLAYAPRYELVVGPAGLGFRAPASTDAFQVTERLPGNATTDFGAPDIPAAAEAAPIDQAELERLQAILAACWRRLSEVVQNAGDRPLKTGPRGGGRSVSRIVEHVTGSHFSYRRRILWQQANPEVQDLPAVVDAIVDADTQALARATSEDMPETGPRGGSVWKPRYFVRRAAWHILDHAWEIEDRLEP